jgi:hypothetical protein
MAPQLIQLSIAEFSGNLAHFNRLRPIVGTFSNSQKQFFMETHNVKGIFVHQREFCYFWEPFWYRLQETAFFGEKPDALVGRV